MRGRVLLTSTGTCSSRAVQHSSDCISREQIKEENLDNLTLGRHKPPNVYMLIHNCSFSLGRS